MQKKWLVSNDEVYDGSQLKSLFAYLEHGVLGDSIVAWQGPCKVNFEHMVDGEDLLAQNKIESAAMVHFIVEAFSKDLHWMATFQRLMTAILFEMTSYRLYEKDLSVRIDRRGDDLYVDDRKFNVSIATVSPASGLIHFGVNVRSDGTPVATFALNELDWGAEEFAELFMQKVVNEWGSIARAKCKVRWVE